jgi:hypothetical protein
MRRRLILKMFAGIALCPLCASLSAAEESHHWTGVSFSLREPGEDHVG